jgi:hypothetical protein
MANITISELHPADLEYEELSDAELEYVVGAGKHKVKHVEKHKD